MTFLLYLAWFCLVFICVSHLYGLLVSSIKRAETLEGEGKEQNFVLPRPEESITQGSLSAYEIKLRNFGCPYFYFRRDFYFVVTSHPPGA